MLKFLEVWIESCNQSWGLGCLSHHGERGDVNEELLRAHLPKLIANRSHYKLEHIFNCDRSGLCYQKDPDRTIAHCSLRGMKSQKSRLTFMAYCSADGSHRLPLLFIGTSSSPRRFKRKSSAELGIEHGFNKKAWMAGLLFMSWLHVFNTQMQAQHTRKLLWLLDNCSVPR